MSGDRLESNIRSPHDALVSWSQGQTVKACPLKPVKGSCSNTYPGSNHFDFDPLKPLLRVVFGESDRDTY